MAVPFIASTSELLNCFPDLFKFDSSVKYKTNKREYRDIFRGCVNESASYLKPGNRDSIPGFSFNSKNGSRSLNDFMFYYYSGGMPVVDYDTITKEEVLNRLKECAYSPVSINILNKVKRKLRITIKEIREVSGVRFCMAKTPDQTKSYCVPVKVSHFDWVENETKIDNGFYRCMIFDPILLPTVEELNSPEIEQSPCSILGYSTRVDEYFTIPTQQPKGKPLLGVELELEGIDGEKLRLIHGVLKNHCIFKRDGSLSNGVEIVSKPAIIDEHRKEFEAFFLSPHNLEANNSCGLHVHMDRKSLSFLRLGKIMEFINREDNANFITKVAGREQNSYCRRDISKDLYFPKDNQNGGDRYSALNLQPQATVEFRLFNSTTNFHEFMSRLEFVQALWEFVQPGVAKGLSSLKQATSHEAFIQYVQSQGRNGFPYLIKAI